jgi:hypothetical protein
MRFRVLSVWSIIATLVVCPLACMTKEACGSPTAAAAHAGVVHSCCDRCAPSPPHRDPADRDGCDQEGDCLCHGAVLSAPPWSVLAGQVSLPFLLGPVPDAANESFLIPARWPADHRPCHFAAADSGRQLRALFASFLL